MTGPSKVEEVPFVRFWRFESLYRYGHHKKNIFDFI